MTKHEFSDKNYKHFVSVLKIFEKMIMKDYHDLYLKYDVLLLAGVFENSRTESINSSELDLY